MDVLFEIQATADHKKKDLDACVEPQSWDLAEVLVRAAKKSCDQGEWPAAERTWKDALEVLEHDGPPPLRAQAADGLAQALYE